MQTEIKAVEIILACLFKRPPIAILINTIIEPHFAFKVIVARLSKYIRITCAFLGFQQKWTDFTWKPTWLASRCIVPKLLLYNVLDKIYEPSFYFNEIRYWLSDDGEYYIWKYKQSFSEYIRSTLHLLLLLPLSMFNYRISMAFGYLYTFKSCMVKFILNSQSSLSRYVHIEPNIELTPAHRLYTYFIYVVRM